MSGARLVPGEIAGPDDPIEINVGRQVLTVRVENTGDRPVQVGSHYHFAEANPALARSIRNRFPYLDPLNHLQLELLKRHRAGDAEDRVRRGIHLTINGLAAGLRNSG